MSNECKCSASGCLPIRCPVHDAEPSRIRTLKVVSYAAFFSDDGGKSYATNALRFATEREADEYANDLYRRCTRWTGYEVRPMVGDEPNRELVDGVLQPIRGEV